MGGRHLGVLAGLGVAAISLGLWLSSQKRPEAPPPPTPQAAAPAPIPMAGGAPGEAYQAGFQAVREGDFERARAVARRLRTEGQHLHAALLDSEVSFQTGHFAEGEKAIRAELSEGDNPAVLPAMVRFQLVSQPQAALESAQRLYRQDARPTNRMFLAEAALFAAASQGGGQRAQVGRQVVEDLRPLLEEPANARLRGDLLAQMGAALYHAGQVPLAEEALQEALEAGIEMRDRLADTANALAWTRLLQGDEDGMVEAWRSALEALERPGPPEVFELLPRWEQYNLYLAVFAGARVTQGTLGALDERRRKLREMGMVDQPAYVASRQMDRALLSAWTRRSYAEARYLLAQDLQADPESYTENPVASQAQAIMPRCVFLVTFEQPAEATFYRVMLGDLAAASGYRQQAAEHYREALRITGGSPVLEARLEAVQGEGSRPPELLDAPGTLRVMAKMLEQGWTRGCHVGLSADLQGQLPFTELERLRQEEPARLAAIQQALDQAIRAHEAGWFHDSPKGEDPEADSAAVTVFRSAGGQERLAELTDEGGTWRLEFLDVEPLRLSDTAGSSAEPRPQ